MVMISSGKRNSFTFRFAYCYMQYVREKFHTKHTEQSYVDVKKDRFSMVPDYDVEIQESLYKYNYNHCTKFKHNTTT